MKSFGHMRGKVKEEMRTQLPTVLCAVSWTWASTLNDIRNHWKIQNRRDHDLSYIFKESLWLLFEE